MATTTLFVSLRQLPDGPTSGPYDSTTFPMPAGALELYPPAPILLQCTWDTTQVTYPPQQTIVFRWSILPIYPPYWGGLARVIIDPSRLTTRSFLLPTAVWQQFRANQLEVDVTDGNQYGNTLYLSLMHIEAAIAPGG